MREAHEQPSVAKTEQQRKRKKEGEKLMRALNGDKPSDKSANNENPTPTNRGRKKKQRIETLADEAGAIGVDESSAVIGAEKPAARSLAQIEATLAETGQKATLRPAMTITENDVKSFLASVEAPAQPSDAAALLSDLPSSDPLAGYVPAGDSPASQVSSGDMPTSDVPVGHVPESHVPTGDALAIDAFAIEGAPPASDAPAQDVHVDGSQGAKQAENLRGDEEAERPVEEVTASVSDGAEEQRQSRESHPKDVLRKEVSMTLSCTGEDEEEEGAARVGEGGKPAKKKCGPRKRSRNADLQPLVATERRPGRAAAKEATRRILNRQYSSEELAQQEAMWAQCDRCGKWRQLPSSVRPDELRGRWFCEMNVWNPAQASCDAPAATSSVGRPSAHRGKNGALGGKSHALAKHERQLSRGSSNGGLSRSASFASVEDQPLGIVPGQLVPQFARAGSINLSENGAGTTLASVTEQPSEPEAPLFQWAQCDRCQKWRRLPGVVDAQQLPEKWYCEMNRWDNSRRSCEAPEEVEDDETAAQQAANAVAKSNSVLPPPAVMRRGNSKGGGESRGAGRPPGSRASGAKRPKPPTHQHSSSSIGSIDTPGSPRSSPAMPRGSPRSVTSSPRQHANGSVVPEPPGRSASKREKPVWNWVQCERRSCRKWRRLPADISPESLPDRWICSMNTWDERFASCAADEEDVDEVEDEAVPEVPPLVNRHSGSGKLSFRELIFNAEGKLRPPFSERSSVTSIFSIGTRLINGKLHDIEAYADSEFYDPRGRDYNVYNATTGRAPNRGLLS